MEEVLDDNILEEIKIYKQDSKLSQFVTPKLKNIFSRLFQNTNVNVDDFCFAVFADDDPNACFINKMDSKNKDKHVIAVSSGLLNACHNEAELAGIIGHECSHYLWGELLGGRNTIFQERTADLRAVDLLINGGYNPLNHLNICERIFSDYGHLHFSDFTLDVHGNGLARVEDIKTYLTKISNEKGYFDDVKLYIDPDYKKFKSGVNAIIAEDPYKSYLTQLLERNFQTTDAQQIKTDKLLNLFIAEIKSGNIALNNLIRFNDMLNYVQSTTQAPNSSFPNITRYSYKNDAETKACQDFIMTSYLHFRGFEDKRITEDSFTFRTIQNFPYYFKLDKFGDFIKQSENIDHFVNYKDMDDAVKWAKEIKKLDWTIDFPHFEYSYLKPRKEEAIGRKHPWRELTDYAIALPEKSPEQVSLLWAVEALSPYSVRNPYIRGYSHGELPPYDKNDYYLNGTTYVIELFGPEAQLKNLEIRNMEKELHCKNSFMRSLASSSNCLNFLNNLADFHEATTESEKIEIAGTLEDILKHRQSSVVNIYLYDDYHSPSHKRRPNIENFLDSYKKSSARNRFVSDEDSQSFGLHKISIYDSYLKNISDVENSDTYSDLEKKLERRNCDDDYTLKVLEAEISPRVNTKLRENIFNSLHELLPYIKDNDAKCSLLHQMRELLENDYDTPYISYGMEQTRKLIPIESKRYSHSTEVLEKKYLSGMMHSIRYALSTGEDYLNLEFRNAFMYNEDSPILETLAQTAGYEDVKNTQKIFDTIEELVHDRNGNSLFAYNNSPQLLENLRTNGNHDMYQDADFWHAFGLPLIVYSLKYDNSSDLPTMMKYAIHCTCSSSISPYLEDLLAEHIEKNNMFNTLPLKDKLFVYEAMEKNELFSETFANKNSYFNSIVTDIEKHPDHNEAMMYADKLLSREYITTQTKDYRYEDIPFLPERERLIEFYTQGKADQLGQDDGSENYYQKVEKMADEICQRRPNYNSYGKFSTHIRTTILDRISTKIVSQEKTAQMLAEKGKIKVSGKDAEQYDDMVRLGQALVSALANSPQNAVKTINFLSHKCTDKNLTDFLGNITKKKFVYNYQNYSIGKSQLKMLHENYWYATLPERAYIMNSLLKAYSEKDSDILDFVVDMNFEKKSPYYKEANRVIRTAFDNFKPYERNLILAALVASNQKDENDKQNVGGEKIGEGLKMFFENKGPAFVKFGQLLSYLDVLDKDIRKPLAELRDKADIPSRGQLFNMMQETMPDSEYKKISHVDKVLGAGSFFVSVKVKYDDKDCVLSLMRPYAKELVKSGMGIITNTIDDLAQQNSDYEPLKNIARQARISSENETNIQKDYDKSVEASRIYDDLIITTPAGEFKPKVAKWESYGTGKDGQVYKIMNMAEGKAMTSKDIPLSQKHDLAVAYTTLELCNLLSGQKWDTDRHQGQQNFANKDFNNFIIGIFDTGAQMDKAPKTTDKLLLGEMLYGMARAARTGQKISDYMIGKVKSIDKVGKSFNFDTLYIDNVQRGLTALSDVMTYQKEIKDKNGKIIQKEKSLTPEDLSNIVNAIMQSGLVDSKVSKMISTKAALNKLRPFRKGWLSSLSEGLHKTYSNIRISKSPQSQPTKRLEPKNKPQAEIEALDTRKKDQENLGVNISYIATSRD